MYGSRALVDKAFRALSWLLGALWTILLVGMFASLFTADQNFGNAPGVHVAHVHTGRGQYTGLRRGRGPCVVHVARRGAEGNLAAKLPSRAALTLQRGASSAVQALCAPSARHRALVAGSSGPFALVGGAMGPTVCELKPNHSFKRTCLRQAA